MHILFVPLWRSSGLHKVDVHAFPASAMSDGDVDPDDALPVPSRMVTIWRCKCHCGSVCSKKHHPIRKCLSLEEAERAVKHHLMNSPYHELSEQEAEQALLNSNCIESWEEAEEQAERTLDDAAPPAKRQRTAIGLPPDMGAWQGKGKGQNKGAWQAGHARQITLNEAQIGACVDTLKRAVASAEAAASICGRAHRAFMQEVTALTKCQGHVEEILNPGSSSMYGLMAFQATAFLLDRP